MKCFVCGARGAKEVRRTYTMPGINVEVPNCNFRECAACGESSLIVSFDEMIAFAVKQLGQRKRLTAAQRQFLRDREALPVETIADGKTFITTRKRAAGGGRKRLPASEKLVGVTITLPRALIEQIDRATSAKLKRSDIVRNIVARHFGSGG